MAAFSTIAAIAGLGAAGVGLTQSLRQRTPQAPPMVALPEAPVIDRLGDAQKATKARDLARRRAQAGSTRSTVLTGPKGLTSEPVTRSSTLLGY